MGAAALEKEQGREMDEVVKASLTASSSLITETRRSIPRLI
jgi:hypothetical protein